MYRCTPIVIPLNVNTYINVRVYLLKDIAFAYNFSTVSTFTRLRQIAYSLLILSSIQFSTVKFTFRPKNLPIHFLLSFAILKPSRQTQEPPVGDA